MGLPLAFPRSSSRSIAQILGDGVASLCAQVKECRQTEPPTNVAIRLFGFNDRENSFQTGTPHSRPSYKHQEGQNLLTTYKLKNADTAGVSTFHGPVSASVRGKDR